MNHLYLLTHKMYETHVLIMLLTAWRITHALNFYLFILIRFQVYIYVLML